MIRYFLHIVILFCFTVVSNAQPTQQWVKRYSNESGYNNYVVDMVLDAQDNSYILGYTYYSNYKQDLLLLKYDETGALKWAKVYSKGDSVKISPVALVLDNSGDVIVSSSLQLTTYNRVDQDFLTLKYNTNGDTLWTRRYNYLSDTSQRWHYGVPGKPSSDNSNNIYVSGTCQTGPGTYILTTVKYDENGNIIREIYRSGGGGPVINDRYDNVYIGAGFAGGQISYKIDSCGNQLWSVRDTIFSTQKILLDKQNNYYLGGGYFSNTTFEDIAVLKYDSSGNRKWLRTHYQISDSQRDLFRDFVSDTLGNIYVSGVSAHLGQMGWDFTTIKYNGNGDTLWVRIYNPVIASDDKANSIDIDKNGNVFVTGSRNDNLIGSIVTTVIYNNNGQIKYVMSYDNNLQLYLHEGIKIKTDNKGYFTVSGNSMNSSGIYDIVLINYSPVTGIQNISSEIPDRYKLYQNYPNPFNSVTKIKYQISKYSKIKLVVFDILGREVANIVNERQKPGIYETNLDFSSVSSGIYFYSLISDGNIIDTKKIVLIK